MAEAADARPRALLLDPADNVAVAVRPLEAGEWVELDGATVELREPIRFGHKFALRPLERGARVLKYHETIGIAAADIAAGEHVHVHNVASSRLPGPDRGAS
jgi:altronate hydrolase